MQNQVSYTKKSTQWRVYPSLSHCATPSIYKYKTTHMFSTGLFASDIHLLVSAVHPFHYINYNIPTLTQICNTFVQSFIVQTEHNIIVSNGHLNQAGGSRTMLIQTEDVVAKST
jgi:hypothetical protein